MGQPNLSLQHLSNPKRQTNSDLINRVCLFRKEDGNLRYLIVSLILIVSLTGCSAAPKESDSQSKVTEDTTQSSAESNVNHNDSETMDSKKSNVKNSEEEPKEKIGLKKYRPEVGVEKNFYEGDYLVFTEKTIAENEEFIQRVIYIGDTPTVQVIKWTADEITIVFESTDIEDPTLNILNDFENSTNAESETLIGENSVWKVLDTKAKVEVPYGTYNDVYVISKTTNEVEGADTIYTYYLAPGMGLIKESFEVTGDQGYSAESVLKDVKK
jgi:hypothetical protein